MLTNLVPPASGAAPVAPFKSHGDGWRPQSPEAAAHIIEIFLQEASVQLPALREAVARRDVAAVERVAHTMKGSAAMLGASSVARSAAQLIDNARHGSFDRGEAIVSQLEEEVAAIRRSLSPRPAPATPSLAPGTRE